jgi:hypothetical protein
MRFQADGENLKNVLDVIDFGGLFSGYAIGPSPSFSLRLQEAPKSAARSGHVMIPTLWCASSGVR